jgi:ABC-type cobalt transport system substrate-binding protein
MKIQRAEHNVQRSVALSAALFLLIAVFVLLPAVTMASEEWPGVDESVVEKIAREHGREAHEPLINTDQGDLLLFAFLLAGSLGGFAAGYCWRMLVVEKATGVEGGKRPAAG